jgi:hypothetical protein
LLRGLGDDPTAFGSAEDTIGVVIGVRLNG